MPTTIAEFRAEYAKADTLYQEVQSFRNKAGIPAMLELRYAGHHFLKSVGDDGQIVRQCDLDAALAHCRRACYEATEAGIMFALEIIKKFKEDYRSVVVSGVIPDYVPRLRRTDEALAIIEVGRADDFDRSQDHASRIEVFRELRIFCRDLDAGRDEANKLVAEAIKLEEEAAKREENAAKAAAAEIVARRRWIFQMTVAILALLVTVSGIIWASTGYRKFWQREAPKQDSPPPAQLPAPPTPPHEKETIPAPPSHSDAR